ncbi:hypothetical protein GMA19_00497 [Paenibacillus polymyxa E681]|uniref:aminoglycoside 6-adenylyltransferase n=1 Tax=Paenibacillus polymyxa TaxID=1406 RepID=UPI0001E311CF|nr:aminoglycoside 6-adenylyltransferase [Paenibacillus polymyxa]ADM68350.1 hypothetical protein PPE_00496 [Paenibacillus polymyxa E681]QNV55348.1 hypothetical protein GE561_00498 [Paenibacillus polymyxa E681]QNV60184.1 hypothetical protein GMA19_00497 [Paenibacillus polymyxa E681]
MFSKKGGYILILFDQGAEVDFLFRHASDLDHIIKNGRIPEGFQRGVRMLLDKTGNGNQIISQTITIPDTPPISEGAYLKVVNMYCFASLYVAKQILHNDLWAAKYKYAYPNDLFSHTQTWLGRGTI